MLKKNVIEKQFVFKVRFPGGLEMSISQRAETKEAARLILKSREKLGELKLLEKQEVEV